MSHTERTPPDWTLDEAELHETSERLRELDRRDWHLYLLCFALIAILTAGFVLLHVGNTVDVTIEYARKVLYGQSALIILTLAYVWQRRRELVRERRRRIEQELASNALKDRYGALGSTLAFTSQASRLRDEGSILDLAAARTIDAIHADRCVIGIVDEHDEKPPHLARVTREGLPADPDANDLWRRAFAWVKAHDTSAIVGTRVDPADAGSLTPDSAATGAALIVAPIRAGGHVVGAVVASTDPSQDDAPHAFCGYERRLVEIIANSTSAALNNHRLLERLRRRRDQLRKSLKRLRVAQPGVILGERLKAMEELVDKVAHYIANPLTTISGYAQILQSTEVDAETRRCLETIGQEVERCNQALNDLKAFAHRPPSEPRSTDLNELLHQALFLKAHRFGRIHLEVAFEPDPSIGFVVLDPVQIQQAFLNVLADIEAAIGRSTDRRLRVVTGRNGDRVHIQFEVERIRDGAGGPTPWLPFAESQDENHVTRDILLAVVRSHGGDTHSVVNANVGSTRFTIELPRVLEPVQASPEAKALAHLDKANISPSARRILAIDDEDRILNLLQRVLAKEGYVVETETSSERARERLAEEDFDVIIADYHMPDVTGADLVRFLAKERPALLPGFIISSGDENSTELDALRAESGIHSLAKPFSIREMIDTVESALAGHDAAT